MKFRTLGKSGLEVSEVGLGCWQLGGDFGPLGDETAQRILAAANAARINFWDTADVYGDGASEQRIAAFREAHAPDVIVATKVGRGAGLYPDGYSKAAVQKCIEDSAQRLAVDEIDLVQLHCVPADVLKAGDLLAWMEDFEQAGLVRNFGASVETLDEAMFVVSHPKLASLQIIFNLLRQDAIEALLPAAMENDVGIIVRLPLASGVLSGKLHRDSHFDATDHRHYNRNGEVFSQGETFSGVPFEIAVERVDELRPYLPAGMTLAQMAVRWILDQPGVSTVIAGASRAEQVAENAAASGLDGLPATLHAALAHWYRERVAPAIAVPV